MPVTLLLAALFIFMMVSISKTDPVLNMLPQEYTQEQYDALEHELGLDQPMLVQYVKWIGHAFTGDFGTSYSTRNSVWNEIGFRIPTSAVLSLVTTVLIVIIGTVLGILCAVHQYSWIDNVINVFSKMLSAIPNFWIAMIFMLVFAMKMRVFPMFGTGTVLHWVLPVITLALPGLAGHVRITRSSMLDCIRQDYIRTARSKGEKESVVIYREALKNAMMPLITMTGNRFAMTIGSAVVVERVFALPGLGTKVLDAINAMDVPVILACTTVLCAIYIVVMLIVDLAYMFVDPRVKGRFVKAKKNKVAA